MATFVHASSQGQRTHSARTNSQIFTPHICTPILGEKYPEYFVLPVPPNYSARTSLEPIKKSYECFISFLSYIIFVNSTQHYAISCTKKAEHPGPIYGLKVFNTLEEHDHMRGCINTNYIIFTELNLVITFPQSWLKDKTLSGCNICTSGQQWGPPLAWASCGSAWKTFFVQKPPVNADLIGCFGNN